MGAPTFRGEGAPTYDFAKFSQKLHEIERSWILGMYTSLMPPLDLPLIDCWTTVCEININMLPTSMINPSFKSHQYLLAGMWKRMAWLPCWPPRDWQVSHRGKSQGKCYMYASAKCVQVVSRGLQISLHIDLPDF